MAPGEKLQEPASRGKSKLAGILRSFSSAGGYEKRAKLVISNPTAEFAYVGAAPVLKRSQVFLDVLQDYLPHEPGSVGRSAKSSRFLNVYRGEIVQLVEPAPNNLVKVRLVNRLGQGLVPVRCVALNPDLTHSSKPGNHSSDEEPTSSSPSSPTLSQKIESEPELESESEPETPQVPTAEPGLGAIDACQVVGIHMWENRIMYRIDCMMASGHRRALSRFYQDFYSLQLQLRDNMTRLGFEKVQDLLPGLPSPSRNVDDSKATSRLDDFNKYLHQLIHSDNIPETVKRCVVLEKWLSPRPGDHIKTPRGSLYKVKDSAPGSPDDYTWESLDASTSIDEIDRSLTPLNLDWDLTLPKTDKNRPSMPRTRSLLEPPAKLQHHVKKAPGSAPTTPLLASQEPRFSLTSSSPTTTSQSIKVKILYGDDCYVAKCAPSEIDTYKKLDFLCRSKLKSCLPPSEYPLTISCTNEKNEIRVLNAQSFEQVLHASESPRRLNSNSPTTRKIVVRVAAL